MNIEKEIKLPDNQYIDREELLSNKFLNISVYTLLDDIPEMICEWWSNSRKDIHTFLQDEELSIIMDDNVFIDVLLGKYYFSNTFLVYLKNKIPYNISLEKLYHYNKNFMIKHENAKLLVLDEYLIVKKLKQIYSKKQEDRNQYISEWHSQHRKRGAEASLRYRLSHQDKVRESKKKYRETHKEQIRAYKQGRREIENEQQRKRYHADIEKSREKQRLYKHNISEEQKIKIRQKQSEYRKNHREEINARVRNYRNNEEYGLKARIKDRAYYKAHAVEISERKKQKRLQNLEVVKAQERQYGKTYREKNKDKINARNRIKYQDNLSENRRKNADKQRKHRNKVRFRTETGHVIFSLLNAIALSKRGK